MAMKMQANKKLIAFSILSILIGVATVAPLAFFMNAKAQTTLDQPQFSIEIPYTYIGNYWDANAANITREQNYGWLYSLVFKATPKFEQTPFSRNALVDYYKVEISSEKGSVGNLTFTTTNTPGNQPWNFTFQSDQWFNFTTATSYGIAGYANGTSLGYTNGPAQDWNGTLGKPETLTLTVIWQGGATISSNEVVIHSATPETVLTMQLQQYGDGFIYNKLFSQDKLSSIKPIMPQYYH